MKRVAIYPGTFDPITNGHVDLICRASKLFDKVIISVVKQSSKKTLFSTEDRLSLVKKSVMDFNNVVVDSFSGLLVDYAKKKNASIIIRGLRAISDFEYEFQMALTNRKMADEIETIFLMPGEKYTYLSSTLIREIARNGGDVSQFVPKVVVNKLKKVL